MALPHSAWGPPARVAIRCHPTPGSAGVPHRSGTVRDVRGTAAPDATMGEDGGVHPLVGPVVAWYDAVGRPLPWRAPDRTPWGVLVSEVMLQQTPVARVLPRWLDWLERWPTPADLAAAPAADVLRAWDRLGYPRRALRLRECAAAIVERHGGRVPATEPELRALPGIGEYTAAAVMAFAFGARSVVLDTNVRRVLARALGGEALPPPSLTVAERSRAARVVPDDALAARWNAAVMELGALVCTARTPACERCPVADRCAWLAAGRPADPHAARRRSQGWHGTDRQLRGRVMAALRAASAPVPPGAFGLGDATERILAGLVADGLVEAGPDGYRLPGDEGAGAAVAGIAPAGRGAATGRDAAAGQATTAEITAAGRGAAPSSPTVAEPAP